MNQDLISQSMIKVWKSFLFPNSINVKDKDSQELEALSKQLMLNVEQFILKFKGRNILSLPEFYAPKLKDFILEGNTLHDMKTFADSSHLNLKTFKITNHKNLSKIYLVEAPILQTIEIKNNMSSSLLNIERFQTYRELKRVHIEGITFDQQFNQKYYAQISMSKDNTFEEKMNTQSESLAKKYENKSSISQIQMKEFDSEVNSIENQNWQKDINLPNKIYFFNNKIDYLPCFKSKYINELDCTQNQIISIQWFSKGYYPSMIKIDISFNKIKNLPKLNLPLLQTIKLSQNLIQNATQFFSQTYPSLVNLDLSNNRLTQIKQVNCPKLQILNIENNLISIMPVLSTPKLKILLMNKNLLQSCDLNLSDKEIKLQRLQIKNNRLKSLPRLNPTNLNCMDLSSNFIQNLQYLAQTQFPQLKILNLTSQKQQIGNNYIIIDKLPQLKMPLLEELHLTSCYISDLSNFFKGTYPKLKYLDLGISQTLGKLPKLNMPVIQKIIADKTSIDDITEFVQGQYNNLTQITLSNKIIIFQAPKGTKNLEQLKLTQANLYQILPLKISPDIQYLKYSSRPNIISLNIQLNIVKSTEFLSFLNLTCTKNFYFGNVHFPSSLYKNLSKINFYDFPNLLTVSIWDRSAKSNIVLPYYGKWKVLHNKSVNIQHDDQWRRAFRPHKKIEWLISRSYTSGPVRTIQFQQRLNAMRMKNARQYCKKMYFQNFIKPDYRPNYRPKMEQAYK